MTEYAVYPLAFERARAYVDKNDITYIASLFRNDYGYLPSKFFINPKVLRSIGVHDGLEIFGHSGVATWEIWVDMTKPIPNPVSDTTAKQPGTKKLVTKLPKGIKPLTTSFVTSPVDCKRHAGGRPRKTSELSLRTLYRRKREMQGILL